MANVNVLGMCATLRGVLSWSLTLVGVVSKVVMALFRLFLRTLSSDDSSDFAGTSPLHFQFFMTPGEFPLVNVVNLVEAVDSGSLQRTEACCYIRGTDLRFLVGKVRSLRCGWFEGWIKTLTRRKESDDERLERLVEEADDFLGLLRKGGETNSKSASEDPDLYCIKVDVDEAVLLFKAAGVEKGGNFGCGMEGLAELVKVPNAFFNKNVTLLVPGLHDEGGGSDSHSEEDTFAEVPVDGIRV